MKRVQKAQKEQKVNSQLPVNMDEQDIAEKMLQDNIKKESKPEIKPEIKPEPKPVNNIVEFRKEVEEFRQPHCWIDTKDITDDAISTWNKIKNDPFVPFTYPVNFGEKRGTIQTANLNSLKFVLHSGFAVQIPATIHGLFMNKINAENSVGNEWLIDNQSADVKQALTR